MSESDIMNNEKKESFTQNLGGIMFFLYICTQERINRDNYGIL